MLELKSKYLTILNKSSILDRIFLDKSKAKLLSDDAKQAGLIIHSVQPATTLNKI